MNYHIQGCDHKDIPIANLPSNPPTEERYIENLAYVVASPNITRYKARRTATGISKPSIFSGLPSNRILGIPGCFPLDLMHLISLNIPDLLISLFRGTIDRDKNDKNPWPWAVLKGDTWIAHGAAVARAAPYLPGSFDKAPRNPAEKMSSGYKAWEFLTYMFCLAPAVLYGVLEEPYYGNFCMLAVAVRMAHQRRITKENNCEMHKLFVMFVEGFERIYYRRDASRLHFCRQAIHLLLHIAPEILRVGPLVYFTQWTMERTIGNLGEEVKQPSNPFANLSMRGLRRAKVNALTARCPELDLSNRKPNPRGSQDLGRGFLLLRARDSCKREIKNTSEAAAIRAYFTAASEDLHEEWKPFVERWARVQLPNGQVARSAWKEKQKPLTKVRMARNVKVMKIA